MRLINFKFIKSAAKPNEFIYDELPQIAVVGRSNVGKSSLINMLANNKKMAKTSSTPGRTRLVNYFEIDKKLYLVDLPGYGFALASKEIKKKWDKVLDDYFNNTHNLKLVLMLIDSRHLPSELDIMMLNYLIELNIPYQIVLTKIDKLSKSQLNKNIEQISNYIRHNKNMFIATSADKKIGVDKLEEVISNAINNL